MNRFKVIDHRNACMSMLAKSRTLSHRKIRVLLLYLSQVHDGDDNKFDSSNVEDEIFARFTFLIRTLCGTVQFCGEQLFFITCTILSSLLTVSDGKRELIFL